MCWFWGFFLEAEKGLLQTKNNDIFSLLISNSLNFNWEGISFFIALLFVERSLKEAASATQEKIPVNYRQSFTFNTFQTGHLPTHCASGLGYKPTGGTGHIISPLYLAHHHIAANNDSGCTILTIDSNCRNRHHPVLQHSFLFLQELVFLSKQKVNPRAAKVPEIQALYYLPHVIHGLSLLK